MTTREWHELIKPVLSHASADTIDRFLDAGIEEPELVEAVRIAITSRSRDPFRYMCGVAWNMVSERQQIAQQIVNAELADDGS